MVQEKKKELQFTIKINKQISSKIITIITNALHTLGYEGQMSMTGGEIGFYK